jgi:hypothetical protein
MILGGDLVIDTVNQIIAGTVKAIPQEDMKTNYHILSKQEK